MQTTGINIRGESKFLSFCVPVYNEAKIIKKNSKLIISQLEKIVGKDNYELLFIENGSRDNTLIELNKIKSKNVRYITLKEKGHGVALKTAIKNADGKFILLTAVDLPFGFSDLKKMVQISNNYSIVFGSKLHPDSITHRPLSRKMASIIFRSLLRIFFNLKIKDPQGSIFIYKKDVSPILKYCDAKNAFFTTQLAIFSQKYNLKSTEIPVIMDSKNARKSKYSIYKDGMEMVISMSKTFKQYKS
jgi:dolichyl-phosphate beta-glucosyltransferase